GVGKVDLSHRRELAARAEGGRRRRPFPDAVHGQDDGLLEWRRRERGGSMALVVLGEEQPLLPVELRREHRELSGEQALLKELLSEPERQRHPERPKAARGELQ